MGEAGGLGSWGVGLFGSLRSAYLKGGFFALQVDPGYQLHKGLSLEFFALGCYQC